MRFYHFTDIILERQLRELRQDPTSLKKFLDSDKASGIMAGFEAELIFPSDSDDDYESEIDIENYDERAFSINEIIDFFENSESMSQRELRDLRDELHEQLSEYSMEESHRLWFDEGLEFLKSHHDLSDEEAKEMWEEGFDSSDYEEAFYAFEENIIDEVNQEQTLFLESIGIRYMSDVLQKYDNVYWPYYTEPSESEMGYNLDSAKTLANSLSKDLGVDATAYARYHSASRDESKWIFEPDSSLEPDEDRGGMPVEIVSPPMPLSELIEILPKFFKWVNQQNAYTNESTGFHVSVSTSDFKTENLDFIKLVLFLGDQYVLKQFGREGNYFTKSAMEKLKDKITPENAEQVMNSMRRKLNKLAAKTLGNGFGYGKYTSINPKDNYVEFRSLGGEDYLSKLKEIENSALRFSQALSVATDPEADKQEYAKKLYKVLNSVETEEVKDPITGKTQTRVSSKDRNDIITVFSLFAAGEMPRAALVSYVKQIQRKREAERDSNSEEDNLNNQSSQLPPNDPYGDYMIRLRQPGADRGMRNSLYRFNADSHADAIQIARSWAESKNIQRENLWLERVPSTPHSRSISDNSSTTQSTGNEFSGEWRVVDDQGREVHRFGGIGNRQEDANRVASEWASNFGDGGVLNVLPIMR